MLRGKLSIAALSILVVVATAHPYAEWNNARYRWNDLFAARDEGVGARVKSQATVESSSCTTVTEKKDGKSYRVRVCTADPEGMLTLVHRDSLIGCTHASKYYQLSGSG